MSSQSTSNSCCVKMAKFILIAVNTLFFILGAAVMGLGLTLIIKAPSFFHADEQTILSTSTLWGAAIFGGALMALAFFGCCGAIKGDGCCGKMFTTIYSVVLLVTIIAQVAIVVVAFIEAGKFGQAAQDNQQVHEAADATQQAINSFVNGTYKDCCVQNSTSGHQVPNFINTDDVVCKALNSVVATGPNEENMCGHSIEEFRKNVLSFFQHSMKAFGIGAIVCAAIELVCLAAACHVMRKAGASRSQAGARQPMHDPNAARGYGSAAHGGSLAFGSNDRSAPLTKNGGFA